MVYAEVLRNQAVGTEECSMDDAVAKGAMALFGEKYGDEVRVVDVPCFSTELCGGTHARRTGDIGLFRITSESSVAAGVRRIEAETGMGAAQSLKAQDEAIAEAAGLLRARPDQMADAIQRIMDERKRLNAELEQLKREMARQQSGDLTEQARDIDGIKVLSAEVNVDAKTLRDEADRLRDTLGSGVVVLGSREGVRSSWSSPCPRTWQASASMLETLIREIAGMVGGGGGGRPDMAQAGGKNPDALPGALDAVYELVQG